MEIMGIASLLYGAILLCGNALSKESGRVIAHDG